MLRLPLPVKLLLSYLGVLLLGAGPAFFYVRLVLPGDLLHESALRMAGQIQKLAEKLRTVPEKDRQAFLEQFGHLDVHRLTYLSLAGDVRIDTASDRPFAINHAQRPEIRMAMGEVSENPAGLPNWPELRTFGYAKRKSESLGLDTLYVARQLVDEKNQPYGVLRLATQVNSIEQVTRGTMGFLRNAMAVAISAAIVFSLVAAVMFVRPLKRVSAMAQHLGSGDLGVKVLTPSNDEVGDVARVLNQMATDLRRRLLSAGMGEALLSQLVESLPCACVVFEENGQLVACNGAGRRALGLSGPEANERLCDFAEHPQVKSIVQTAEHDGQAEPVKLELTEGQPVSGLLHVLKRAGLAPLRAFVGLNSANVETSLLPMVDEVVPRPVSEVLDHAKKDVLGRLFPRQHRLDLAIEGLDGPTGQALVADANGRLVSAIAEMLSAISSTPGGLLTIGVTPEPTRLRLHLDSTVPEKTAALVRSLVEPLGGELEVEAMETKLWLPRA